MKGFDLLRKKWKDTIESCNLQSLLDEKLPVLQKDPSEEGVASCIELLHSFGEESFSHILCVRGDQLELNSDLGIVHRHLWEKMLLECVCTEQSPWYDLYESEVFSDMEFRVCGESEWGSLSNRLKEKVVKKSLMTVSIPSGTFLMGALDRDEQASDSERPRHQVTLTHGFEMCIYACTQGLYESVMG